MTTLLSGIPRWATGRRLLQATLVSVLGSVALFRFGPYSRVQSIAGPLPEESVTGPDGLYLYLGELGEGGRELYTSFQLWDFLNPLAIGLFSVVLVGWLVARSRLVRGRTPALLVPFVGPIADACENGVLLMTLSAFPAETGIATLFPFVTMAKFLGLAATLLLSVGLGIVAFLRRNDDHLEGRRPTDPSRAPGVS